MRSKLKDALLTVDLNSDISYDMQYWEDAKGNIIHVSQSCERITGYSAEEFISNPKLLLSIVLQEDRQIVASHNAEALEGKSHEVQFRIKHKNESTVWIEHVCKKLIDEDGVFQGLRASNRDITHRKLTEDIFKTSPSVLFLWENKDGWPIAFVSDNVEKLTEYSKEDFLSSKILYADIIHSEDIKRVGEEVKAFSNMNIEVFDHKSYRILTKSGKTKWVDDKTQIKRNRDGEITHFQGSVADITKKMETESKLEESEGNLRAIFENMQDVYYKLDANGKILEASPSAVDLYKYDSIDEIIGEQASDFSYSAEEIEKANKELDKKGYLKGCVLKHKQKNGEPLFVETNSKLLFDSFGNIEGEVGVIRDITEKMQIQKSQDRSEEKFRLTFETSPDSININRMEDGLYVEVNSEFLNITGYTRDEVIGKSSYDINFWQNSEDSDKLVAGLKKNGFVKNLEAVFVLKDKTTKIALISATIIELDNVPHIISITRDITQRKEEEEKLLLTQFTTDHQKDAVYWIENSKFIYANESAINALGYSRQELLTMKAYEIGPEYTVENWSEHMEQLKGKSSFTLESLHERKDKSVFPVEVTINLISFHGREINVSVAKDITERMQAEEAIKSERRLLRTIIDNLPDAIYAMDLECRKTVLNRADLLNMGCISEDEAIGKTDFDFFPREEAEKLYANDQKVIQNGQPILELEESFTDKDGQRHWLLTSKVPLLDSEGKITGLVGIGHDITKRKYEEKELIEAKERAEKADKMKSIFLAQMSHEIRTPINALVSMASLLRYDFEEGADEDQLMSFEIIDRAGGRIIRTVDLLLNLSEIQAGTYEIITSQFDVVSDVIAIIIAEHKKTAAKKNIVIKIDSNMVDTELFADSYTVNQIFTQLMDNAIKYTEEGEVTIKTLRNELDQLVVEIKDTGIGIAEEYLPDLFKPFSQEEMGYTRKFEGNGIGLALVSKYCELNNAKIEVESKKGVGSTFRVVFQS